MNRLASPRARLAVVGVALAGVLGTVAVSGLSDSLVYYRTPSEVQAQPTHGRVRLGGMVESGSVVRVGATLRFLLTDGAHDVPVAFAGRTTGIFREGQGAVVEGTLDTAGVFHADTLLVKHSNEYVDGRGKTYHPPTPAGAAAP
ncbi:MAG: cytochrome c maturation protein CcmE [Actinobacteria bacterium]|nr:cytochrome c maturation protein CcmE [Actinomycetota bacterium]MBI3686566.1 cytochrome c maturation protein CcmE [Actinomycetota bacterium]